MSCNLAAPCLDSALPAHEASGSALQHHIHAASSHLSSHPASAPFRTDPTRNIMPGPLEARCERDIEGIQTISRRLRRSALTYRRNQASNQSVNVFETLYRQLDTICTSCDAMLEAISLVNFTMDDQITDWVLSGGPRACLDKLKDMDDILTPYGRVGALARPFTSTEDRLVAVMSSFDKHGTLFRFLLNPDFWLIFQSPAERFIDGAIQES